MRIDKYLKLTHLIKRRAIAKEIIDEGGILLNNKIVKPSKEVKIGDILELKLGTHIITIKVISTEIPNSKNHSKDMFDIIDDIVINSRNDA